MEAIYIEQSVNDDIKLIYPKKSYYANIKYKWWYKRFIQFSVEGRKRNLANIHFELTAEGHVELHLEGSYNADFADLAQYIYYKTNDDEKFEWSSNEEYELGKCFYSELVYDEVSLKAVLKAFVDKIDSIVSEHDNNKKLDFGQFNFDVSGIENALAKQSGDDVSLIDNMKLGEILQLNVNIPDYQRIYCWDEKNVIRLLDDITNFQDTYRMGTIILHVHDNTYDVIDGQQRLVTLSLILRQLGYSDISLLKKKFCSNEAIQYIAYNRFLIETYINQRMVNDNAKLVHSLLENLEFSVLIINSDNLDLAYTFFSNENSRGKSLSDFDLLKAHHLRYIVDDPQAEHLAKSWDAMLSNANKKYESNLDKPYYRALGLYVFRLRHWIYNDDWDDFAPYKIKYEYEAAPIVDEVPSFGEHFDYNEAIQGGAHFFAFVKRFEYHFNLFADTEEYQAIHKLDSRTHWWFRDVIETLLFGYYLKFGTEYLSEALIAISRIIMQFRFDAQRADYDTLLRRACESGILPIIDRATSPTFVLAGLIAKVRQLPTIQANLKPISREFRALLRTSLANIKSSHVVINEFKRFI